MEPQLYSARLERKVCISESSQCYHFEFVIDGLESFPFAAGQFVSVIACIGMGRDGQLLNVNADTFAGRLAVLIDARRLAGGPVAPVIPIGALARYDRPAPALGGYDALLTGGTW